MSIVCFLFFSFLCQVFSLEYAVSNLFIRNEFDILLTRKFLVYILFRLFMLIIEHRVVDAIIVIVVGTIG